MYYFNVKKEVKQGENSILWFTSFILFVPSNALEFILEAFKIWNFSWGLRPQTPAGSHSAAQAPPRSNPVTARERLASLAN